MGSVVFLLGGGGDSVVSPVSGCLAAAGRVLKSVLRV